MSSSLNIFERAVQDPFSEACDNEDEEEFLTFNGNSRSAGLDSRRLNDSKEGDNDYLECEDARKAFANLITGEKPNNNFEPRSSSNNYKLYSPNLNIESSTPNKIRWKNRPHNLELMKIRTAPHRLGGFPLGTSNMPHAVSQEDLSPVAGFPLRRNRANSSSFIHHLSRQTTGQSNTNQNQQLSREPTNVNASATKLTRSYSLTHQPFRKTLPRHSSCFAIPTHLYGLEKYVLSELDALSTKECNNGELECNKKSNIHNHTHQHHHQHQHRHNLEKKLPSNIKNDLALSKTISSASFSSESSSSESPNNSNSLFDLNITQDVVNELPDSYSRPTMSSRSSDSTSPVLKSTRPLLKNHRRKSSIRLSLENSFSP